MAATKQKIDFTNVKEQGNFRKRRQPEGDYVGTIKAVEDKESNAGNAQWVFTVTIEEDPRASYPIYCGLDDKQAWKIRKLFIACGKDVPKKMVLVDPNKLVGLSFGATLEDDEYEGRPQSNIVDFVPLDEMVAPGDDEADDEAEDEVYERPARKAAKKKAAPVEEDDEEEDDEEPEPAPRKRAAKKAPARRAPEPEEDDEYEDDDEEDEPAPAPRRSAKKAAPAKKAAARRRPAPVEDDEDDEDLDLDDL